MRKRWMLGIGLGGGLLMATALWVIPAWLQRLSTLVYTKVDVMSLETAVEKYAIGHDGRYPDTLDELITLDEHGQTILKSTRLPLDPWGRAYLYMAPCREDPGPRIWTYGKDGEPGGEDDDADFGNWMLNR